jgi:Protein of unknown function (DUF1501)
MNCGRYQFVLTRRAMLARCANGFGALALAGLTAEARGGRHHHAKAKSVIFLYMDGGPSQLDTFDPKPLLAKHHGRNPNELLKVQPTQFDNVGKVLASPWKFAQHGQSGLWVSELLPHVAKCADDLCVVRSLTSKFSEHTSANYFLHTGHGIAGRPSMGAWFSYGLGSENRNLPGFVVLNGGLIPVGGLDNLASGFLPAAYQGSIFKPASPPVANIRRLEATEDRQRDKIDLINKLDRLDPRRDDAIESAIANYETAFRMQAAVPELTDLSRESQATKTLYGLDATFEPTRIYGTQCLLARRLIERGVRFIELTCPSVGSNVDRWDQHSSLKEGHEKNCRAVDQPIAALLIDLKSRGLLDSTLVVWAGEFGRTPFAQGSDGRDHNPFGFTVWLAGGGLKTGTAFGETDEWGYHAVKDKLEMYDLHATMLHLLGIDHTKLTIRFGGRDMRLTDVHGNLIRGILA